MMKSTKLVRCVAAAICFLLLADGVHHAVARPHRERHTDDYTMFVFGDSFVDAGNRPRTSEKTVLSRAWFYPYGMSDSSHRNRATGRVSDGLVQSDILAKILGQDESPPPSRVRRSNPSGVNFAVGGSGVFDSAEAPSLRQQVDQFKSLLDNGIIDHGDLQRSVALVAVSTGRDYFQRINQETGSGDMRRLSGQVTDEIVDAVTRIKGLGVGKVLVNLLPPLGCLPWQSIASNYDHCDGQGNMLAGMHNSALRGKLESSPYDVYMLDLYTIFADIVQSNSASGSRLQETHTPCCANQQDPINGYCGQEDDNGREQYSLCDNPDTFFFWDYIHPTQAGWEAVMERLEGSIEEFLEIQSSWS
ncbi:hypothetical protein U9M48_005603 [Paspalum notatum var. saurae]|uniref:GDSL esterase/lipase n=1 Tax=Paspalum notatum var. saurae TaxID=547442 RepID=A0AAQ3PY15_PASNO